ncbi:MAG: glycosyltransferase family 87 protein [Parvularculaceae bacterium]
MNVTSKSQSTQDNPSKGRRSQDWDAVFSILGGRILTMGALFAAILVVMIAALTAPEFFAMPTDFAAVRHGDIDAFIRAGELTIHGAAVDAYDKDIFIAPFSDANLTLLWFYPPHGFFAFAPLGLLPFEWVRPLWIAATFAAMAAIALRGGARSPLLTGLLVASPATFMAIFFLQISAFVALGLTSALVLAPKRPILSGVLLGVLTIKPQYGLMAPVLLAATGQWRAIAAAAITTIALVLLSVAAFGVDSWTTFLTSMREVHEPFSALAHPATISLNQLILKLGAPPVAASAVQGVAIIAAAIAVFVAARNCSYRVAAGLALLLSVTVSPSAWTYDWVFVAAALVVLAAGEKWPPYLQAFALLMWIAPFIQLFGRNFVVVPILLAVFSVLMTWRSLEHFPTNREPVRGKICDQPNR